MVLPKMPKSFLDSAGKIPYHSHVAIFAANAGGRSENRMGIAELFLLAVGLSMDAFAVSICKGLATPKVRLKHMLIAGLWFGGFQALMPLIGYLLGSAFQKYITAVDHWVAFLLLIFIGGNMIKEAFSDEEESADASFGVRTMFLMAVATSIDALAVGITFALLPNVNIVYAITFIGITTFLLSGVGVKIGNVFGARFRSKAELAGGIILVLIGCKILFEHLGLFPFA
jgi:putative Mn2+ efflux pump MntP